MNNGGTEMAANVAMGGELGFEAELFKAANKTCASMEKSDYNHVVLGLILLTHVPDGLMVKLAELEQDYPDDVEDDDKYGPHKIFWVPKPARWSHQQANAERPTIGKLIHGAMLESRTLAQTRDLLLPKLMVGETNNECSPA